jgi:hypothetical protein
MSDGRSARRTRSWPFATALVLFVALLGALPHVRFSLLVGETAFFSSAYDEATYALWVLDGGTPGAPNRWLSHAAFVSLWTLTGRAWDATMLLADVVFPVVAAGLAWLLAGRLAAPRLLRLLLALALLFAQEFFSLGCWTIFQVPELVDVPALSPSPPTDWRSLRAAAPEWAQLLVPDYGSPFLSLFRTPEPQVSQSVLLAAMILLLDLARLGANGRRGAVAGAAFVNLMLGCVYLFHASAIVVFEGVLALALFARGERLTARVVAVLAAMGAISIGFATTLYHASPAARAWSFASRLPVLTPASIVAVVGLLLVVLELRRHTRRDTALAFAAACFGSVLVLTNQQLVTGRMISTRDWERYVDYSLVVIGAAILGATWLRRARVRLRVLYALAGAGLLVGGHVLLVAQDRVFEEEFLFTNLKSMAMTKAVNELRTRGLEDALLVLEEPELVSLVQIRLNRRVNGLLDIKRAYDDPADPLDVDGGRWGARSAHKRQLFEYFARRPRTPGRVARILKQEADTGVGFFLSFLFHGRDWWRPASDGRAVQPERIGMLLPGITGDFEEYLESGDPCWSRPAVVLTRESPAARANERWNEVLLAETTVGRDQPLMNVHALLQTAAAAAPAPAPGRSGCD